MLKKISAFTLSVLLAAVCFTSCGNSSSSSSSSDSVATSAADSESGSGTTPAEDSSVVIPEPSLTIDDEKVETDDLVLLTVDGRDVNFDMFRYYYAYVCSVYGITPNQVTEDLFEDILSNTVNQMKQEFVTLKLADENDITLDDEDKKKIEEEISSIKSRYESEEAYQESLKQYYLTEDVLQTMEEMNALFNKVNSTLFSNGGKYTTKLEDFKEVVQNTDEYARAIHILIPYCSQAELDSETQKTFDTLDLNSKMNVKQQAYDALDDEGKEKCKEASKKLAEEVLAKALDGEDFRSLIDEYGWDPGMESEQYKEGYYIRPTSSFVPEFLTASFALKENEITSELVENSSYGYFIIKRLPVDLDYVEEYFDSLVAEYDAPKVQEIYNQIMDEMEVTYSDSYNKMKFDSIT